MHKGRSLSATDRFLIEVDQALKAVAGNATTSARPSPAEKITAAQMSPEESRLSAGLMRVNHTGEVCAQALYKGQSLTARLPDVRQDMENAANEETDHLAWCRKRLEDLDSRPSLLNPLFYAAAFGVGAIAGLAGDRWSLGFVAETEHQVCKHLDEHLNKIPEQDKPSRAILAKMKEEEAQHAVNAQAAGGTQLPLPVRSAMRLLAKVMTKTTYHL